MHDPILVHMLQSLQKTTNNSLSLTVGKAALAVLDDLEEGLACE